jgi:acyl carrier protein
MIKQGQRSREEITTDLTTAIKACLVASGRTMPSLRGEQCPLTEIEGFDSLCGIEVTVELQERLGVRLEDNIFVQTSAGRPKARTVNEIVQALASAAK